MRYLILGALVLGALLGYYALWSHLADRLALQADSWFEAQRAQGRDAAYDSRKLWGFPYRLSLTLTKPRWHDPQSPAGWALQADEVTAHLQLWDLHHVIFDLGANQSLGWKLDGSEQRIALKSDKSRASLVLDGAGNWLRAAADFTNPDLTGAVLSGPWSATRLLLHARRGTDVPVSTDLAIHTDKLELPPGLDGPLGREVKLARLIGTLRGNAFGKTPEELLGTWRDSGGILDLQTVTLYWNEMKLEAEGSLSLDRQFRPLGAMSGRLYDAPAAFDALVAAGRMRPQDAALAKTGAALLSRKDEKSEAYIPAQFSAQEGWLSLGPVRLFSLSPVLPKPPQP